MWARRGDLRGFELGSKGEMQDRLNSLVLAGDKRATAGLWNEDYAAEGEPSTRSASVRPCSTTTAGSSPSSR